MHLSRLNCALRRAGITVVVAISALACAQDQGTVQAALPQAPEQAVQAPGPQRYKIVDYSKPRGYFPNLLAPYEEREIPKADMNNTPRIESLIKDGSLYLSLNDAVALALENNLDLAIFRYNLNIADTDVMRSRAGGSILGVNSGVLQGTPGGQLGGLGGLIGSGNGGTVSGAGGAGSGFSGIVSSTLGLGSPITSYDPIITGTFQYDDLHSTSTSPFSGTLADTGTANLMYTQGFHTGTALSVGFDNSRTVSNSAFTTFSPNLNSNFRAEITQHLLQGFGFAPNTRFITIAKNNREGTDVAFRLQIITTVDQIENMYWSLVYAYEYLRVQQESLAFAQKTLGDTKKQVEIGTLAPIEVVQAQSTVSTDQQFVTTAQTNLELQELLMKNALSRTMVNQQLVEARVVPTSQMQLPPTETVVPIQDLTNSALTHRADLEEQRISLKNTEISNKAVRNILRPSLDLFAYYGGAGVGGDQNSFATCNANNAATSGFCVPANTFPPVGYGSTLNQLVNSTAPDRGVGLTLNIPIRNRLAQSEQIRAILEYRQSQMRLQQLENQVRIEVRNAQFDVQQNRAAVEAAQAAVDFSKQSLDAEQKKLALGASTSTLVLQNQSALATSESNLVSAMAAYEKSKIEMDRATGLLLDHSGILISDAERGQVTHMPNIPFVTARPPENPPSQTPQTAQPAQQQQ
ncbi:MAG TPA: TolC family protein [Terriglobales bacterium]